MFPLRDSVRARRRPVVTLAIVVVCAIAFLYELSLGDRVELLFRLAGFVPSRLFDVGPHVGLVSPEYGLLGNGVTILTSMFLHGGWMHLLGNLWFLWVFGDNVEDALGRPAFVAFYLAGGAVATLAHGLSAPGSPVPTIGASGAIAAVLGAYLVWYPHSRVHSLIPLGFFVTFAEIPAPVFLGIWFLLQLFQGTFSIGGAAAGGVAWFAHVGGFVFGAVLAWILAAAGVVRSRRRVEVVWEPPRRRW